MKIQINQYPIDFEIENEETVQELMISITNWTNERDLVLTETSINDTDYPIDQIPDIPLSDVDVINFTILSKADISISSLYESINYCGKVQEFIQKSVITSELDITLLSDLTNGINWIIEVLRTVMQLLSINLSDYKYKDLSIEEYINQLKFFSEMIQKTDHVQEIGELFERENDLFESIISICKMLLLSDNMKSLVMNSIDSPDVLINSLFEIRDEIPNQLNNLEETAIAFQTGKDDLGSAKLETFIEFFYGYSRTCYQISPVFKIDLENIEIEGKSLSEKNQEIMEFLNEIIYVMENNDIISLSDILEYEIKPAFEDLDLYISSLIDFLTKKV